MDQAGRWRCHDLASRFSSYHDLIPGLFYRLLCRGERLDDRGAYDRSAHWAMDGVDGILGCYLGFGRFMAVGSGSMAFGPPQGSSPDLGLRYGCCGHRLCFGLARPGARPPCPPGVRGVESWGERCCRTPVPLAGDREFRRGMNF